MWTEDEDRLLLHVAWRADEYRVRSLARDLGRTRCDVRRRRRALRRRRRALRRRLRLAAGLGGCRGAVRLVLP